MRYDSRRRPTVNHGSCPTLHPQPRGSSPLSYPPSAAATAAAPSLAAATYPAVRRKDWKMGEVVAYSILDVACGRAGARPGWYYWRVLVVGCLGHWVLRVLAVPHRWDPVRAVTRWQLVTVQGGKP